MSTRYGCIEKGKFRAKPQSMAILWMSDVHKVGENSAEPEARRCSAGQINSGYFFSAYESVMR